MGIQPALFLYHNTMNKTKYLFLLFVLPFLLPASDAEAKGPKTLLYKITGNGLEAPSYLYGTMHVGDKRAYKFSKSVLPSFESCDAYAMELDFDKVDQAALMQQMKMKEGKLKDLFTEEEWTKLDNYFQTKMKSSINDFNDFSPFFVQALIAQSQFGSQMGQAVDMYFFKKAKAANMKTMGIETMEEQIDAINSLPTDEQKDMLLKSIEEDMKKATDVMLKYYSKGKLDKLADLMEEEETGAAFEKEMVTDRNHTMAERIAPIIREQSTFIGVGALHLPGEEGVIELLRKQGFTVEGLK